MSAPAAPWGDAPPRACLESRCHVSTGHVGDVVDAPDLSKATKTGTKLPKTLVLPSTGAYVDEVDRPLSTGRPGRAIPNSKV